MDKGCKKQSVKEIEQKLEPEPQHLRKQVLAWLYPGKPSSKICQSLTMNLHAVFQGENLWLSFVSHRVHDLHVIKKRKWERVTKKKGGTWEGVRGIGKVGTTALSRTPRVEDRLRGRTISNIKCNSKV